jgi:hypothetical protein
VKASAKVILFSGIFLIGAMAPAWAESGETWGSNWYKKWHKAKFGHPSQAERAEKAAKGTAYRSEPQPDPTEETLSPAARRYQKWHKAKFGHDSPKVAAEKREKQDSTAFRQAPVDDTKSDARKRYERWHKAKFGHPAQERDQDR